MPPAREQARTAPPKWWAFVLAGLCYSLFTALAFLAFPAPARMWVLAVFAPVPLVWAGCRATQRTARCAILTTLGAMPLWFYEQAWLWNVTQPGYPILAVYLSLYAGAFVWLFAIVRRCWLPKGRQIPLLPAFVLAPIVWTALEVVRGEIMLTGYPWYLAGHPLIEAPFLAAPASLLGAYFASFLLVALSGALADAAGWMGVKRGVGGTGAGATLVLWTIASLLGRQPSPGQNTVNIGVVQTSVPQDNKKSWTLKERIRDWEEFVKLTREAAAALPRPDLIVWPETMFPGEGLNAEFRQAVARILESRRQSPEDTPATAFILRLLDLQTAIGIPMLIGEEAIEGFRLDADSEGKESIAYDHRFNSTFLVLNGEVRGDRYDKIELTPFGEIIPYVWRWPRAQELVERFGAGGMKFDLTPGTRTHVFALDLPGPPGDSGARTSRRLNFVTPICFEATKSELCRRLAYQDGKRRADLLVNVSNDGWFGPTGGWWGAVMGGRRQHLQAARWRCVELGIPMVRAVNTGISASIDQTGKIRHAAPDGRDSSVNAGTMFVASVAIPAEGKSTVFGRMGNIFGWGTLVLTALLPAAGVLVRRRLANRPVSGA